MHTALYLLFNEGYFSTADKPILREICRDAMLLTQLLAEPPAIATSDTLRCSRSCASTPRGSSRGMDEEGRLIPLDQQDRRDGIAALIRRGFACLARSARDGRGPATRYHLEAAIAARHCSAATFERTDWVSICRLYDRLLDMAPSPMVALNRAVAVSYRDGAGRCDSDGRALHVGGRCRTLTSWPPCSRTCTRAPARRSARGCFWTTRSPRAHATRTGLDRPADRTRAGSARPLHYLQDWPHDDLPPGCSEGTARLREFGGLGERLRLNHRIAADELLHLGHRRVRVKALTVAGQHRAARGQRRPGLRRWPEPRAA